MPVFQVFDARLGTYIREATEAEAIKAAASPSGVGATTDEGRDCYVVPSDRASTVRTHSVIEEAKPEVVTAER